MTTFFFALFAGVLTVATPCVLPVLPIVLGGTWGSTQRNRTLIILSGLGLSVLFFTVLLRASTVLIMVPNEVWVSVSGGIIILFGATLVFPKVWTAVSQRLGFEHSQELLSKAGSQKGSWGAFLLGASLGPVFTSCSPTYAYIIATVLPTSWATGGLYLVAYIIGLLIPLYLIARGGQAVVGKLRVLADPNGWFRKVLGILLLIMGLMIIMGWDKDIEAWLIQQGVLDTYKYEIPLHEVK